MFFIPSFFGLIGMNAKNHTLKIISQSLIASTLISGVLILIFNYYVIHFINMLGFEMHN